LEEKLGFGNGSIAKSETMRSDRLLKIAHYFNVTTDYLINGEVQEGYYADETAAAMMQKLFDSPGRRALFDAVSNPVTPIFTKSGLKSTFLTVFISFCPTFITLFNKRSQESRDLSLLF